MVPAVHALHPGDGYSQGGDPPRFVGYVLELEGVAIYHAGDTIATDEVLAGLDGVTVDVALLPVNGRTYFREREELAGNLGPRDAVALAAHCGARMLVPIHWDLMEGNTERGGRRRRRGGRGRRAAARDDAQPGAAVGRCCEHRAVGRRADGRGVAGEHAAG